MTVAGSSPRPAHGFLALGDSYTIGEGVDAADRWPAQLAAGLARNGQDPGPLRIIATTGWTTDELDRAIDAADAEMALGTGQALVSLLIGVNNQYRGRPLAEFAQQFDALLARAIGFAADADPHRVLVLSIPDWGLTPFAASQARDPAQVATELDAFNQHCRQAAVAAGAHWIDIAPLYRLRGAEPGMLAEDGLHPAANMYSLWAALALPAAREALR